MAYNYNSSLREPAVSRRRPAALPPFSDELAVVGTLVDTRSPWDLVTALPRGAVSREERLILLTLAHDADDRGAVVVDSLVDLAERAGVWRSELGAALIHLTEPTEHRSPVLRWDGIRASIRPDVTVTETFKRPAPKRGTPRSVAAG